MRVIGPMIALCALVYFVWLAVGSYNHVHHSAVTVSPAAYHTFVDRKLAGYKSPYLKKILTQKQATAAQDFWGFSNEEIAKPVKLW